MRASRAASFAVALVATVRVPLHHRFDFRPRFGGAEASDLANLVRHHWGATGLDVPGATGFLDDPYKPPLFYGGIPELLSGQPTLTPGALAGFLAVFTALGLFGAWRLGHLLGGDRGGLGAVIAFAGLPGIAGRAAIVGVEPLHAALVLWLLVALVQLDRREVPSSAGLLAAVVAVGMLTKWTFAIPLVAAVGVASARAWRERPSSARWMIGATALGLVPFAAWMGYVGAVDAIAGGAGAEASTAALLGIHPALYYPAWLVRNGLQPGGVLLAVWALTTDKGWAHRWLLAVPLAVLAVHQLIPHKELRYLVPGLAPVAVWIGVAVADQLARSRVAQGGVVALAIGLGLAVATPPRIESELRFRPHPDERIIDAATDAVPPGAVVLPIFGEPRWPELRDMLVWELHWRRGAVLRPVRRELSSLLDFEGVDVVLTQTAPDPDADRPLTDAGFRVADTACLELDSGCPLTIWTRSAP